MDAEESSGVTLAPVPVRTMRLSGLDDADRTQFFSVNTLLERGRAVAAREQAKASEAAPPVAASLPPNPGVLQQLREASWARKASALLLPLLILLLLVKPVFKKPKHSSASATSAAGVTPVSLPATAPAPALAATPPEPAPSLPRGVSLEKAAADAVAGGDFQRAGALYRELSRREPGNVAYREAERILDRRRRAQLP